MSEMGKAIAFGEEAKRGNLIPCEAGHPMYVVVDDIQVDDDSTWGTSSSAAMAASNPQSAGAKGCGRCATNAAPSSRERQGTVVAGASLLGRSVIHRSSQPIHRPVHTVRHPRRCHNARAGRWLPSTAARSARPGPAQLSIGQGSAPPQGQAAPVPAFAGAQ